MSKRFDRAGSRKAEAVLSDLHRAAQSLANALDQPESEFIRDAAIQRFEFCFELAWKSIQILARIEGSDCASPRAAFSTAWKNRWISEEEIWLDMLDERNKTTHTYHEATAREVFASLPRFLPHLQSLRQVLSSRLQQIQNENQAPPS